MTNPVLALQKQAPETDNSSLLRKSGKSNHCNTHSHTSFHCK
ncbi:hypothetical protein [Lactobacillus helsingborgensis]|nr:hypothetical protein [Lactobacillus helsingborgensis]